MDPILQKLLHFRKERNWEQFHSPRNIAQSIVLESAEILEIFQWKVDDSITKKDRRRLAEEIADVYNWLILLSHDLNINLQEEALKKIEINRKKYPVEKSKGTARKYTQLWLSTKQLKSNF